MSKRSSSKGKAGDGEAPRGGWWRVTWRWLWMGAGWLATAVLLAGLPMRLLGDESDALAIIFYATPWAVLMVCGILATWFWWRRRKFALGLGAAALLCVGGWIWTGVRFGASGRGAA